MKLTRAEVEYPRLPAVSVGMNGSASVPLNQVSHTLIMSSMRSGTAAM